METKNTADKIRHLFQTPVANGQTISTLGGSTVITDFFTSNTLAGFFNGFFKVAIVIGAMLAVMRLGYAGFVYMTTDSFGTKGSAKQIIQDAMIGLLLLLSIWLILYQINPNLLNLNILQNVPASGYDAVGTPINNNPGFGGPR